MNNSSQFNVTDQQTAIDPLCTMATVVSNQPFRWALLVGECIVGVLAVSANVLFMPVGYRLTVFPSNLRLLMGHLSFILCWYSVGCLSKAIYLLRSDPCTYNISLRRCKTFDLVTTSLTLPMMMYSLTALCVERVYACLLYKKYDKIGGRKPWLAGVLIIICWVTAFSVNGPAVFSLPDSVYVPVCDSVVSSAVISSVNDGGSGVSVSQIYLPLEFFATISTLFIYFYSRRMAMVMCINTAKYDLSSRFLVSQNQHVNKLMLPLMASHFVCHLPTFAFQILNNNVLGTTAEWKAATSRITFFWRLVYALAHPILAICFNRYARQYLKKSVFKCCFKNDENEVQMEANAQSTVKQEVHFNVLEKIWTVRNSGSITNKAAWRGVANKVAPTENIDQVRAALKS